MGRHERAPNQDGKARKETTRKTMAAHEKVGVSRWFIMAGALSVRRFILSKFTLFKKAVHGPLSVKIKNKRISSTAYLLASQSRTGQEN